MKFTTLMSGSKGNCTFISSGKTKILVDMGCSLAYLRKALAGLSLNPQDIDALFITHEHIDHIKGISILLKHYDIPVFASPLTWEHLPFAAELPHFKRRVFKQGLELGCLGISFFKLSHDACQPVGLVFEDAKYKLGLATDTGTLTPGLLKSLKGADGLIIEANYSCRLLEEGPYPQFLKKRIAGIKGHLSNIQCAHCLENSINSKTKAVLLAHLSEVNNTPAQALLEIGSYLKGKAGPPLLFTAPNRSPHPLIALDQL